jgi:hypothetical protein
LFHGFSILMFNVNSFINILPLSHDLTHELTLFMNWLDGVSCRISACL